MSSALDVKLKAQRNVAQLESSTGCMNRLSYAFWATLTSALAFALGCSSSDDSVSVGTTNLTALAHSTASETPSALLPTVGDTASDVQQQFDQDIDPLTVQFEPPFPHRQDPFRRPDFKSLTPVQRENVAAPSDVQLKGFVNLDGIRALLAINGNIVAIAPGSKKEGVEVIEITPLRVILQQGRFRWTETLLDQP